MWIKIVSPQMTDFYSGKLKFEVGKVTASPVWNPEPVCGGGIHFSRSLNTVLQNTKHNGTGYLIEVQPQGLLIEFEGKAKAPSVKTIRVLSAEEWLETLSQDDSDWENRLMRACKLGLETLSQDDSNWWNRLMRACKLGLETLSQDDSIWENRLMRACKIGLETLDQNDSDWENRLMRACKMGLETLDQNDSDWENRLMRACKMGLETLDQNDSNWENRLIRACKTGYWKPVFEFLK
jgi:hypothetical protein